jgi:hypothetical protein
MSLRKHKEKEDYSIFTKIKQNFIVFIVFVQQIKFDIFKYSEIHLTILI